MTVQCLQQHGLMINLGKSLTVPAKRLKHLDMVIDTRWSSLFHMEESIKKMRGLVESMIKNSHSLLPTLDKLMVSWLPTYMWSSEVTFIKTATAIHQTIPEPHHGEGEYSSSSFPTSEVESALVDQEHQLGPGKEISCSGGRKDVHRCQPFGLPPPPRDTRGEGPLAVSTNGHSPGVCIWMSWETLI